MSFWQGFAQAFKDADEKKTEDRRIQEERDFLSQQKADDRKWEEDFFFKKLRAESDEQRRTLLLQGTGRSGRRSTGSSGSGGDDSSVTLEALVRAHPELDPEVVAQLAPYPEAIATVFETLNEKKTDWANARQAWTPETSNNFIMDIVPDGDEDITPERVADIAQMYGVDPSAEVYTGSGTTWGDVISQQEAGDPSAEVLFDPTAAPDPMKPEAQRLYRETAENRMKGYLATQLQQLNAEFAEKTDPTSRDTAVTEGESVRLRDEISAVEGLLEQVENGFLDEALSSEYGTKALQDLWNAGDRTEYKRFFPSFKPHFASPEEAKAALASGFVQPGQSIMVLVDGVYKQARF